MSRRTHTHAHTHTHTPHTHGSDGAWQHVREDGVTDDVATFKFTLLRGEEEEKEEEEKQQQQQPRKQLGQERDAQAQVREGEMSRVR